MRTLVAGVGNVFLGDDGFGVAVARSLAGADLPEGVEVADFGIRGIHLAYELTAGRYDATILVDAAPRGKVPGTLYVLEPSLGGQAGALPGDAGAFVDGHAMTPEAVLALAGALAGDRAARGDRPDLGDRGYCFDGAGRVLLVGCEPYDTSPGMELSRPVADAVGRAAELVLELIAEGAAAPATVHGEKPDAKKPNVEKPDVEKPDVEKPNVEEHPARNKEEERC
ncbi:hydrogenase maturation protease [Planotetraspora sp. A-T 1434]|uniref:hydrogenase maturation protease n=1 Tax=Planotetraspora sp. A-T 1434 TaxID=2979219 RepID=UPI0021C180A6|nr:hydrogenase maturation protease [Planotetraspora sp. A-T 1434]MCT9932217.1 hydrogenase maturation protease [Planotetraspora sp. A-T 1434]